MEWFGIKSQGVALRKHDASTVWKTYIYWAFWVGVAFFALYPSCNWLSSQRSDIHRLYFDKELSIPFVPEFIWAYISMYLLFFLPPFFLNTSQLRVLGKRIIVGTIISAVVFLLFPSRLGFERISPDGFYGEIFVRIFSIDLPYNMAPSLHIVYSSFILLSIYNAVKSKAIRLGAILWLTLISLSTLLVHQHHIVDIILALLLTEFVSLKLIKGEKNV